MSDNFKLSRNAAGRLVCSLPDGSKHAGVVPVRAFPLAAPNEGLSLVSPDGHELAWINSLDNLDAENRALIEAELASREFMPVISRIQGVASYAMPSTWTVETDRGTASFVLKGEEDIRRLPNNGLLIADNHGILFHIPDRRTLDRNSRKILTRFL
ncbi:MAG TPA: DUF1854 domain-containing protein [Rhodocyclaceae bacterium]|nr:DUF1854 domain-containing protein [Rhodocyclaceae bacterium]